MGTIERVRAHNQTLPNFTLIYPGLALRPIEEWHVKQQEVNASLATALREGWDEVQAQRRVNGPHAQFHEFYLFETADA